MLSGNIILILFTLFISEKRLFLGNNFKDGTHNLLGYERRVYMNNPDIRYKAKRELAWALILDFPQHMVWIIYLVTRFFPDKLGGDVTIFPGYQQLKKEKELADKMDGISSKSL